MNQSEAMKICYGGIPQLQPLIREQLEKEKAEVPNRFTNLLNAAQEAADWLTDAPLGTDPYERGVKLLLAIERVK